MPVIAVVDLRLQPQEEPRVADFRFAVPKVGRESAFDAEVTELQFDCSDVSGKVVLNIAFSHKNPGYSVTMALRRDQHGPLR